VATLRKDRHRGLSLQTLCLQGHVRTFSAAPSRGEFAAATGAPPTLATLENNADYMPYMPYMPCFKADLPAGA